MERTASLVEAKLLEESVVPTKEVEIAVTTVEVDLSSDLTAVSGSVSTTSLERVT